MSRQKFKKEIVYIARFPINVTTNVVTVQRSVIAKSASFSECHDSVQHHLKWLT